MTKFPQISEYDGGTLFSTIPNENFANFDLWKVFSFPYWAKWNNCFPSQPQNQHNSSFQGKCERMKEEEKITILWSNQFLQMERFIRDWFSVTAFQHFLSLSLSPALTLTHRNKQTNKRTATQPHTHAHTREHAHALIHTFFLFLWCVKKGLGHAPSPFALHHLSLGYPNLVMLSGHYLCEIAMHTILLCKQWEKIFLLLSLLFYQYSKHWKTL